MTYFGVDLYGHHAGLFESCRVARVICPFSSKILFKVFLALRGAFLHLSAFYALLFLGVTFLRFD